VSVTYWLVSAAQAEPLTRAGEECALVQYGRSLFGHDWVVLSAHDKKDALGQAILFYQGNHPHQREILLFAQAYRVGGVDLPHTPLSPNDKTDTVYPLTHRDK
jgi:hypothetical protein